MLSNACLSYLVTGLKVAERKGDNSRQCSNHNDYSWSQYFHITIDNMVKICSYYHWQYGSKYGHITIDNKCDCLYENSPCLNAIFDLFFEV